MADSRRSSTSSSDGDDRIDLQRRYNHYVLPRHYNDYNNPNNDPFASDDEDELARRIGRRTRRLLELEAQREEARNWVPPRAEHQYEQEENVARLRHFQHMPPEQQRRVLRLNLHENYTTVQAIDTVRTEAQANLLHAPLAACIEHTATIRLLYNEAAEKMFCQWNTLEYFVRGVPEQDQKAPAERIFRLVSIDPYDRQFMMSAARMARELLNKPFLESLLDEMVKTAFVFKGHDAELRALRRYDQPPANPPKLVPADDGLDRLADLLKIECRIERAIGKVRHCLQRYKELMIGWLVQILERNRSDRTAQVVAFKYPELWQRGNYNVADCFSEIIDRVGEEHLKNYDAAEPDATEPDATEPDAAEPDPAEPEAADPFEIMCIGFYHCCLGICGRASYQQIERVAARDEWPELTTAELAKAVRASVSEVYHDQCCEYEVKVATRLMQGLKDEPDPTGALPDFLNAIDGDTGAAANMALGGNWDFLPADVQARIFSFGMAEHAGEILGEGLYDGLYELTRALDDAAGLVDGSHRFKISGPAPAMGMHRRKWIAYRAGAYPRVTGQLNALAQIVNRSSYEKPREAMLKQLRQAMLPTDIARLRNLASAGNVELTVKESVELVIESAMVLDQVDGFVGDMENRQLARLAQYDEAQIISNLSSFLDGTDWQSINSDLHYMLWPAAIDAAASFTRWDIGGPLRRILSKLPSSNSSDSDTASSDASSTIDVSEGEAIKTLSLAALHKPTTQLLAFLQHPPADTPLSRNDVILLSRLVLRGWYLAQERTPATVPDQLRWLSRHCWQFGLLAAWDTTTSAPRSERLVAVTTDLLRAPDVADPLVLPDDLFGLAPPKGVSRIPEASGYAGMHGRVRVEGCVVDGGRMAVLGDDGDGDDAMETD
ncbi:hypothetical protein DIS24_g12445 [Lasiodiplodia hormozganensis]|uniref:Uncharacterized protein n=1 Tax=Lasiodiplodia hormozganensis TaxID=869390 RepID=A0AA39TQ89_9PEZI|nr:hypothetical protein DIS24_g12445 [Lasiodiplodia hormozganensis]